MEYYNHKNKFDISEDILLEISTIAAQKEYIII